MILLPKQRNWINHIRYLRAEKELSGNKPAGAEHWLPVGTKGPTYSKRIKKHYTLNIKNMPDSTKVNINSKAKAQNTYDAIVIGSGISGGWAAKELCEKGMKTL